MGWFTKTVATAVGGTAQAMDPVTGIANAVNTVLQRVLPDKPAQIAAQLELSKMQLSGELAQTADQLQINAVEAASTNWFVAGWRPAVGWTCVVGLFYSLFLQPVGTWVAALFEHPVIAPRLDMQTILTLLGTMLGVGTLRTVEKIQGVDTK